MNISLASGRAIAEKIRSLYEHDDGVSPEAAAIEKKASGKTRSKYAAKARKRREEDYNDDKESEDDEYESVFSSESADQLSLKGGYKKREAGESAKAPGILVNEIQQIEIARPETKAKAREAKAAVSDMLSSVQIRDAEYFSELSGAAAPEAVRYGKDAGVVKIEYNDPVFMNNQWTYQRIFMRNDRTDSNVYEFTVNKAGSTGLETKVRFDEKFNTFYFESLNGVDDGLNQAYWEVWLNGEIVEDALDKTGLKKGDVVEWRLANERESFCGGGGYEDRFMRPELRSKIKSMPDAMNPAGPFPDYAPFNFILPQAAQSFYQPAKLVLGYAVK